MTARCADQSPAALGAHSAAQVEDAVREALNVPAGVALAVSGGRDSMVLLHAAARVAAHHVQLVLTFDHRTGPRATESSALVQRVAGELGFPVMAGVAARPETSEAGWRAARWTFLGRAAGAAGALAIATAHTEDDQVETVFMRALRGAGPRGLAALFAPGPVLRPLLGVSRDAVAVYARRHGVAFVDDPANRELRFLRNRVRHELLPAAERVRPGFRGELLALARDAAVWRTGVDAVAGAVATIDHTGCVLTVPAQRLAALGEPELAVLWPALAARVGVTLDRRGTRRLAGFTNNCRSGDSIPVSGGATVRRFRDRFVLCRRTADIAPGRAATHPGPQRLGAIVGSTVRHGRFRFRRVEGGAGDDRPSEPPWAAEFDADALVTVRSWVAGDRMQLHADGRARRVKRFFADAHVPAFDRPGWPVVLVNGAIAWIPGVRRSDAATVRPGRPGVRYECDRNDG